MASAFTLKVIDRTDRNKAELNEAMEIYRTQVRPEEQNPERQILHWIDNRKDILTDEFQCFTIKRSGVVVGYLQYSYFSEEHIFFLEYLCMRTPRGTGLTPPRTLLNALRQHFAEHYRPNPTMVFEVAHDKTASGRRVPDQPRLKYFRRFGFRRIEYPYRYPILQTYDGELSYPADLVVRLPDERKVLSSAELRTILRCLYYKHYLRWDRPFLDPQQFDTRQQLIDTLYAQQIVLIGNHNTFPTDGDDNRPSIFSYQYHQPKIKALLAKIFGPKLPRLVAVVVLLLLIERALNSVWLLIPFILLVAVMFCLAEDTESSRKILSLVLRRLPAIRQR